MPYTAPSSGTSTLSISEL
jgi:FtsZ-binding cell division protein ZapB